MIAAHDVEAVRRAEAAVAEGLPEGEATLIARASSALARTVARELRSGAGRVYGASVVLLVGSGTNGGDALHAGALLAGRGAAVTALLTGGQAHEPGLAALRRAGGRVLPEDEASGDPGTAVLAGADVVVDGMLGTGGRPGLRGTAARLAAALREGRARVVAVDVPSGTDVATGALPEPGEGESEPPAVRADVTVAFGTAKPSLLLPPAAGLAGRVEVADIGLRREDLGVPTVERLEAADLAALWPVPTSSTDKYSRGVLGVVAGGASYTGAAVMATGAAVRSGAGMVRYLGPKPPTDLVRARWPEVVPGEGRVQAWLLGPGVDPDDAGQAEHVDSALAQDVPCVVDAGALPALAHALQDDARGDGGTLVVPHAGELSRFLGLLGHDVDRSAVEARPLEAARRAADDSGVTVLLKGATTVVVEPGTDGGAGRVRSQQDGPPWLATAGSGDVLAGVVGALAALGLELLDAASVGTAVHGLAAAAASGGGPLHAEAVLHAVPDVVAALLSAAGTAG